jgi:hypothetical protein
MSGSSKRVRMLVLTAVCTAALGLAACGDDEEDPTTTTPATGATGAESTESTDTESGEVTSEVLRDQLLAGGIPEAQVDCVMDAVQAEFSEEDFAEIGESGEIPQDLLNASTEAAQECLAQ